MVLTITFSWSNISSPMRSGISADTISSNMVRGVLIGVEIVILIVLLRKQPSPSMFLVVVLRMGKFEI